MFLSGINFTLLLLMFNGKIKKFLHDAELKFYFICVSFFTLFIAIWLHQTSSMGVEEAFRKSLFQVVSLQTSTGFVTADYMLWYFYPLGLPHYCDDYRSLCRQYNRRYQVYSYGYPVSSSEK